jgi:hypothetical protein
MPRFFFNIQGEGPDGVGVDLPDRLAARGEAIRTAGEILREIDGRLRETEWKMVVEDENGEAVLELTFVISEGVVR